jgi:hypothetical protein
VNGGGSDLIGMVEIDFEADDTLYSNLTIWATKLKFSPEMISKYDN